MIVRNKKNGYNVLAFKEGARNVHVPIKAGEIINIPALVEFEQVVNKQDFGYRGWFEIITENKKMPAIENKETNLEKAKKEVEEYSSKKKKKRNN